MLLQFRNRLCIFKMFFHSKNKFWQHSTGRIIWYKHIDCFIKNQKHISWINHDYFCNLKQYERGIKASKFRAGCRERREQVSTARECDANEQHDSNLIKGISFVCVLYSIPIIFNKNLIKFSRDTDKVFARRITTVWNTQHNLISVWRKITTLHYLIFGRNIYTFASWFSSAVTTDLFTLLKESLGPMLPP